MADLQAKLEHLDGLQKDAESFDPVVWMREMSELLGDVHAAFAPVPNPNQSQRLAEQNLRKTEAARRILRVCLPKPLKVAPDPAGGWNYDGDGLFREGDIRAEVRRIRGHLAGWLPVRRVAPSKC